MVSSRDLHAVLTILSKAGFFSGVIWKGPWLVLFDWPGVREFIFIYACWCLLMLHILPRVNPHIIFELYNNLSGKCERVLSISLLNNT